jgi:superfamily II DNA or RNA helicase
MTRDTIQEECLEKTNSILQCTYQLGTGMGKSKLTLMFLDYILKRHPHFKILLVIPKTVLINGWLTEISKYKYEHLLKHISFVTYLSLDKKNPDDYDVLILDECQNLKYKHEDFLNSFKNAKKYIRGLTGTYPEEINSEKFSLCQEFCPIGYSFKTEEGVENKILNDYKIYIHMLDLDTNLTIPMQKGKWKTSEQKMYDYWNTQLENAVTEKQKMFLRIRRMSALKSFQSKVEYAKKLKLKITNKCLIFANTQKQADELSNHSYHSKNKKSEENLNLFKQGKIQFLSCVEQLNEGVNVPELKSGVILHSYSNNRLFAQKLGRFLRLILGQTAIVHVLCYRNTADEQWVKNAMKEFNSDKITYLNLKL